MERYWNESIECMSREEMKKLQDERLVAQVKHGGEKCFRTTKEHG